MKWTRFVVGLAAGLVFGACCSGLVAGIFTGYLLLRSPDQGQRVPVVVAIRDLAPGTSLQYDDLAQRNMPRSMVTKAFLRPDWTASVIQRALLVPVTAGEPLQRTDFQRAEGNPVYVKACAEVGFVAAPPTRGDPSPFAIRARLVGKGAP